jgi:hypothetical protein
MIPPIRHSRFASWFQLCVFASLGGFARNPLFEFESLVARKDAKFRQDARVPMIKG